MLPWMGLNASQKALCGMWRQELRSRWRSVPPEWDMSAVKEEAFMPIGLSIGPAELLLSHERFEERSMKLRGGIAEREENREASAESVKAALLVMRSLESELHLDAREARNGSVASEVSSRESVFSWGPSASMRGTRRSVCVG